MFLKNRALMLVSAVNLFFGSISVQADLPLEAFGEEENLIFTIREVPMGQDDLALLEYENKNLGEIGAAIEIIDGLIALGERVYKIIDENRSVITTKGQAVSVLPQNITEAEVFYQMVDWSFPEVKKYSITARNGFNVKVIDFQYLVSFQYGGSYENKGSYLRAVKIIPAKKLEVVFPYDFSAIVSVEEVSNLGTLESPVAAVQLKLEYTIRTWAKNSTSTSLFFISGKGDFRKY